MHIFHDEVPSFNTLVIESLSTKVTQFERDGISLFVNVTAELRASIEFFCTVNSVKFQSIVTTVEARANHPQEAIRKVIQRFIDKDFIADHYFEDLRAVSRVSHFIHNLEVRLKEPYKSLFEQLFDVSTWQIPLDEIDNKTQQ